MIEVTEPHFDGQPPIDAYGGGGFRFGGARHEGSILILPQSAVPWPIADIESLTLSVLAPVLEQSAVVDLLLVGTGAKLHPIPNDVRAALREEGLGVELMDTGAACRTFNVLLAEERRIAAALIAVD